MTEKLLASANTGACLSRAQQQHTKRMCIIQHWRLRWEVPSENSGVTWQHPIPCLCLQSDLLRQKKEGWISCCWRTVFTNLDEPSENLPQQSAKDLLQQYSPVSPDNLQSGPGLTPAPFDVIFLKTLSMTTIPSKSSQKEKIYMNIGAQFHPVDLTSAQGPWTQHLDFFNCTPNQCQMTYEANSN